MIMLIVLPAKDKSSAAAEGLAPAAAKAIRPAAQMPTEIRALFVQFSLETDFSISLHSRDVGLILKRTCLIAGDNIEIVQPTGRIRPKA